ncbi:uncharacterized protein FMAN_09890 [Fusarium mangiferae]|uniref:DUF3472 domain protein n=1 Tax=Fusarium mangiferae TaxID=192010 RepID=A0A1L7TP59_FUSMA|nr:uncharacterized protein FMAN_09890 [Fusarium mangiferae]CVL00448.1 uncharacterized protein FMAN_09890 [Fusarium mangiferae]
MKLTAGLLILNLLSLGLASIYNEWGFDNAPSTGLNDITFPMSMKGAPRTNGYYFAQQFSFKGMSDVGYTGLQPRPEKNGKRVVHAVFSSFQDGTTTQHKNCHAGADGGPGVSCAIDIFGSYSHLYHFTVRNIGGTTWRGTLTDTATGKSNVIGEWKLPSSAGKIDNGQVGFVEYFNWNDGTTNHECKTQPFTQVFFGNPTSRTSGAIGGAITKIYEAGECVGKLDLKATKTTKGYKIKAGFVQ